MRRKKPMSVSQSQHELFGLDGQQDAFEALLQDYAQDYPLFAPLDHHQHAQDLLSALSELQQGPPLDLFAAFPPDHDHFGLLFAPPPSAALPVFADQPLKDHSASLDDHVLESLLALQPPLCAKKHSFEAQRRKLDKLNEIDKETEVTLISNELYSGRIRTLLDQVSKALERGEELEVSFFPYTKFCHIVTYSFLFLAIIDLVSCKPLSKHVTTTIFNNNKSCSANSINKCNNYKS